MSNAGTAFIVSDSDDCPTAVYTALYRVSLKGSSTCEDPITDVSVKLTWTAVVVPSCAITLRSDSNSKSGHTVCLFTRNVVGLAVITGAIVKMVAFWGVTPCGLLDV